MDTIIRRRFRNWAILVFLLLPVLALLAWSGGAGDPRRLVPWDWTKTGWIIPSRGLTFVWIFAAGLFGLLCGMAFLLFHPVSESRKFNPWLSAALILVVAIVARIIIARMWIPLPLDPAGIHAKSLPASVHFHAIAVMADVLVIGLLLLALKRAGRSVWWAVL